MKLVKDPSEIASIFRQNPAVHLYGLGDLEEPFWSRSRWFRRDNAVVGLVDLGTPKPINMLVYAISESKQSTTVRLLLDLAEEIPDGSLVVAPAGTSNWMSQCRSVESHGPHLKLAILDKAILSPSPDVVQLDQSNLTELDSLYDTEPGAAFFLPDMLSDGLWVGIRHEGRLLAAGGTHLLSVKTKVAALGGVFTRPDARGRGLGTQITSQLVGRLMDEGFLVGLNVRTDNLIARRIYRNLGFEQIHEYEEFTVLGDENSRKNSEENSEESRQRE